MMARAINQKMMLVSILALLLGKDVEALDIYLARMVYQNESGAKDEETKRLQEDLFQKLASAELNESVSLHKVDGGESPPESYLDAARLSESQGYANLLYGYIKRTSYSYYAEVKLLTRENKDITATFIGGDDDMHYQRLVDDLAAKIVTYIRDDLGMAPLQSRKVPVRNILTIPVYVGYWAPMQLWLEQRPVRSGVRERRNQVCANGAPLSSVEQARFPCHGIGCRIWVGDESRRAGAIFPSRSEGTPSH